MNCPGVLTSNPLCMAAQALSLTTGGIADSAFSHVAGYFGLAATKATEWLWQEIDQATTLDLNSPQLLKELGATGAVAAVLCLGLFVLQVITSALRREPAGLSRAVVGLFTAFVGSALALATTRLLLGAVDQLSAGVVHFTMGTNVAGLGAALSFAALNSQQNPAAVLLLAFAVLTAVVVVWAAMMIRKLMIVIAAVMAPLAFSGATADFARGWVRKWIEFIVAMVVSKLLLVIVLSIGVAMLQGAGQSGNGVGQSTTQMAASALVLMLGGFSPFVAIRMFHFTGDTLHAAHATAAQATAGGRAAIRAPQKVAALHAQGRMLLPGAGAAAAAAAPAVGRLNPATPRGAAPEGEAGAQGTPVTGAASPGRVGPAPSQQPGEATATNSQQPPRHTGSGQTEQAPHGPSATARPGPDAADRPASPARPNPGPDGSTRS